MIIFKEGVTIQGMRPEISIAITVLDRILERFGVDAVITSVVGFKHSKNSKHYFGCAFDGRSKELQPNDKQTVLNELRAYLTEEFTVILEDLGGENEHFHCQFGKKGQVLEWKNPQELAEIAQGEQ